MEGGTASTTETSNHDHSHATAAPEHPQHQHHDAHSSYKGADKKTLLLVLIAYALISSVIFYPIAIHASNTVAGIGGDPYQTMWNIWWVGYATFTLHHTIWSSPLLFWPLGANLIDQTMMPIGSILVYPLTSISIPFAYNVLFFIGMSLSGLFMFMLADYIVKNKYAAFIAGIIFAFSTFHISQAYGHLNYANIEFVPLSIYLFIRIIDNDIHNFKFKYGKYIYALALSLSFVFMLFMGDIEQGLITLMLFALIAVLYLIMKNRRSKVLNKQFITFMALFVVISFILGAWAFIPIIKNLSSGGFSLVNQLNDIPHNELWSDDLLSYLLPSQFNGLFNSAAQSYIGIYHGDPSETTSYLGYAVIALALFGVYKVRKPTYLWLVIGAAFLLLSLGPYLQIAGGVTGIPLPYLAIKIIPILDVLREPGRFDMIVSIAAAILAAFGAKELLDRIKKTSGSSIFNTQFAVFAAISFIVLIELSAPLSPAVISQFVTHVSVPKFYSELSQQPGNFSVLELPIITNQESELPNLYPGKAMFTTAFSHKPIIGGYLTRDNTTDMLSMYNLPLAVSATNLEEGYTLAYPSPVSENYTNQTLLSLYLYKTSVVTLDKTAYQGAPLLEFETYLENTFGSPIYNDNTTIAFSTTNAIADSLFRSYVSYPGLLYWSPEAYNVNGTNQTLWTPENGGSVLIYAPLNANTTILSNNEQLVKTTVNITAVSLGITSKLAVEQETNSGPELIGQFNITNKMASYTLETEMVPGVSGNQLFFIYDNQSYPVGIKSVSFYAATSNTA